MDKLEKFIQDNRADFDSDEPKRDLWGKIEDHIPPEFTITPKKKTINYWQIAAVLLLLVSSALVVERFVIDRKSSGETANEFYSNEFQEAEGFYLNMVAERKAIIEEQLKDDPTAREEFLAEVEALDQKYEQLQGEIKYGNQEEILDAMILNLQMRIEVLNRQIEIIERFKDHEKENGHVTI